MTLPKMNKSRPSLTLPVTCWQSVKRDRKRPKDLSELPLQLSLGLGRGEKVRAERKASCMKEEEILKGIPENKDDAPVLPVNHPYKIFSWRVMSRKKKKKEQNKALSPTHSHEYIFRQFQSVCIPFCICFICCYFNQFANHFCALV